MIVINNNNKNNNNDNDNNNNNNNDNDNKHNNNNNNNNNNNDNAGFIMGSTEWLLIPQLEKENQNPKTFTCIKRIENLHIITATKNDNCFEYLQDYS